MHNPQGAKRPLFLKVVPKQKNMKRYAKFNKFLKNSNNNRPEFAGGIKSRFKKAVEIVKAIDPKFTVEYFEDVDDTDNLWPSVKVSFNHAGYGELKSITPLTQLELVEFWPTQKKAMLNQSEEDQIRGFAKDLKCTYEEAVEYLNTKKLKNGK